MGGGHVFPGDQVELVNGATEHFQRGETWGFSALWV